MGAGSRSRGSSIMCSGRGVLPPQPGSRLWTCPRAGCLEHRAEQACFLLSPGGHQMCSWPLTSVPPRSPSLLEAVSVQVHWPLGTFRGSLGVGCCPGAGETEGPRDLEGPGRCCLPRQ